MGLTIIAIFALAFIIVLILIIRWLGAWMLRIDEVIKIQKHTYSELKKIHEYFDKI